MSQRLIEGTPVLVVEDDLFFSVRIESALKKMGCTVQVITNAEDAISQAAASQPALVIINFGSDRLSPGEVVRNVKALPVPPLVLGFVSHVFLPQVRPNAMGAGCDALVANSALMTRLPQLVEKLLTPSSAQTAAPTEEPQAES